MRKLCVVASFAVVLVGVGVGAGPSGTVVYDAIPETLVNPPSLGPEAYSYKELGDRVTLAAGSRTLQKVDLLLSSWACKNGNWNLNTCDTPDGATFDHSITLNIYGADGTTSLGSITRTFTIPYRPSANASCIGDNLGKWSPDGGAHCYNGFPKVVTFEGDGVSAITLPETFVFGITYNTTTAGYSPIGNVGPEYQVGAPYDSLNVGLSSSTNPSPSPGVDATGTDGLYWYTTHAGFYCDGGTGGTQFREDNGGMVPIPLQGGGTGYCWSPNGGITIRFTTGVAATAVTLTGFYTPVDNAPMLNKAKAGQSIPLKFSVMTALGAPVTDLASVNVTIATVPCNSLASTGTDPLEGSAAGESGLLNLGNGYYQWNWKTTKTTTGCRVATLGLPDTYSTTPLQAYFEFKK